MDVLSYALSKKYTDQSIEGISGVLSGKNCTIESANKVGDTTTVTFKWTADNGDVRTTTITVVDGETPAFSSVAITNGHKLTFTTLNPQQTVEFNVMDGAKGEQGISVVRANVDDSNNLTLTLSNGNVIDAGKIKAVTTVDNELSTSSANPVENKVITEALNDKVDKEMGKGLSTEDFTTSDRNKLDEIEDNAQVNTIESLIINGQEATIVDKSIALTIITSAVSNLQNYYLKTETYTKQEVEDLIGSTVGVTIEIVQQLPAEGQSNIIYFLPTETEGVYSQYIYTTDGWILIGSTTVDLSNYYTKTQVDTLLNGKQNVLTIDSFPTAMSNNPVSSGGVYNAIANMQPQFQFSNMPNPSASNLGFIYQYTGASGTYETNMFYRCIYDYPLGEYRWEEVIFHATVTVDSELSSVSTNPVQNMVVKAAIDTKQDKIQYTTMPSAQDNLGHIVQYTGVTTANYLNGYFYKAVYDSKNDTYVWIPVKFSADMLVDNALSTTSENPVQNKVITGAINDIQDLIPSTASVSNQLVDRDSLGSASQKNFTSYVSPNNADIPISSSVYAAISAATYGAYHPSGSKTIAELTSDLLIQANIGNVYKITEDGVTTNLFIGGAGQTIHTGDNAVVVYGGQPDTYLFDLQSGSIDLSGYQTKELSNPIEMFGTQYDTVESSLGVLGMYANTSYSMINAIRESIPYKFDINPNGVSNKVAKITISSDGGGEVNGCMELYGKNGDHFVLGFYSQYNSCFLSKLVHPSVGIGYSFGNFKHNVVSQTERIIYVETNSDTYGRCRLTTFPNMDDMLVTIEYIDKNSTEYVNASDVTLQLQPPVNMVDGNSSAPVTSSAVYNALAVKQNQTLDTPITVGGVSKTTVEGALGGLNDISVPRFYYNPDTSHEIEQNRIDAIEYILNNLIDVTTFVRPRKIEATVRYSGGVYFQYTFTADWESTSANGCDILEVGAYNKIIGTWMGRRTNATGIWAVEKRGVFLEQSNVSYSTSETKTGGTWIDGKPIYRKVYNNLSMGAPTTGTVWQSFGITLPTNMNKLVGGRIARGDNVLCNEIALRKDTNDISYINKTFNASTGNVILILEYTKTTD